MNNVEFFEKVIALNISDDITEKAKELLADAKKAVDITNFKFNEVTRMYKREYLDKGLKKYGHAGLDKLFVDEKVNYEGLRAYYTLLGYDVENDRYSFSIRKRQN